MAVGENFNKKEMIMWNIVQCAVQGRSHVKSGTPCQDKVYSCSKNKCDVIALADGAGSAKYSHFGAERITQVMGDAICENFDVLFNENDGAAVKRKLIDDITLCLDDMAKEIECERKDLASTFLLAAVCEERYIIIHIGDGVIGYLKDDELKVASHPENDEFANVTYFTTSKNVLSKINILKGNLGNINGFALMSDGTEFSFYDKRKKSLCEALKKIMLESRNSCTKLNADVEEFFETQIKQRTNDDCSLITIVRAETRVEDVAPQSMFRKLLNAIVLKIKSLFGRFFASKKK